MRTRGPKAARPDLRDITDPQALRQPREGRPHAGRLLLYVAIAAVSALAVTLPGLDGREDAPASARINPAEIPLTPHQTAAPRSIATAAVTSPTGVTPVAAPGPRPPAAATAPAAGTLTAPAPPPAPLEVPAPSAFSWPAQPEAAPRPVVPPDTGVFLGAYHDPFEQNDQASASQILTNLPAFNAQIGRRLAIVSLYQPWAEGWVLNESLTQVADTQGAIPMISWRCGDTNERVAAGAADDLIFAFAYQLRGYARPVLLRWFWEMNLLIPRECLGEGTQEQQAASYRAAYQRIATIFDMAGATNVAFVWAPSTAAFATDAMDAFYPGDEFVDWIGADGYSRRKLGVEAFAAQFGPWYAQYAGKGKPMIVAETGATKDQVDFLRGIADVVPRDFPQIKALVYFDAASQIDWRLTSYGGAGVGGFAELGQNPYFAVMPTSP